MKWFLITIKNGTLVYRFYVSGYNDIEATNYLKQYHNGEILEVAISQKPIGALENNRIIFKDIS